MFLGWLALIFTMMSFLDLSSRLNAWVSLLRLLSPFVFVGAAGLGVWGAAVVDRHRKGRDSRRGGQPQSAYCALRLELDAERGGTRQQIACE